MTTCTNNKKHVLFIGAAGEMCRVAIHRFAAASDLSLVLSDINTDVMDSLYSDLPVDRITKIKLDLFDPVALLHAVKGALLVVLGAGPFMRTAKPVLKACLEAKVPYLDFGDDVESTQAALDWHEEAVKAGVPCYINCGASPGMTNVMAVDVANELDKVETLDVCWVVGDEKFRAGKAVLEHLMHIASGPCLTWVDGKPTVKESWVETAFVPMIGNGEVGETILHETAHPEPVTLARAFPNASRIRCLGGMDPAPKMGIARGLGSAIRRQALTIDEAVEFYFQLRNGNLSGQGQGLRDIFALLRTGDFSQLYQFGEQACRITAPWRYALMGMVDQIRTGESTVGEVFNFITTNLKGEMAPYRGALLARAVGFRNGHPAVVIKRTPKSGKDNFLFKNLATVTGTCCAAFMLLALEPNQQHGGVFAPEDWAKPQAFYNALERLGTPREEIIESLTS